MFDELHYAVFKFVGDLQIIPNGRAPGGRSKLCNLKSPPKVEVGWHYSHVWLLAVASALCR